MRKFRYLILTLSVVALILSILYTVSSVSVLGEQRVFNAVYDVAPSSTTSDALKWTNDYLREHPDFGILFNVFHFLAAFRVLLIPAIAAFAVSVLTVFALRLSGKCDDSSVFLKCIVVLGVSLVLIVIGICVGRFFTPDML